jgi:hypothetical protein
MTTHIDLASAHILSHGLLPKSGGEYVMFLQGPENMESILELQDKVIGALSEEEKSYLLEKKRAFFEKHFANGNLVLGVAHDGQLIAQSVILHPTVINPKTGMVDMELPAAPDKISLIQGVVVDPAYRGNMLMSRMVDGWLDIAKMCGRTHAIAEVTVENHFSWAVFLNEGMSIHSTGVDPNDGTQVYNIHSCVASLIKKRLCPDFNKAAAKDTTPVAAHDIETQKQLIKDGYEGVSYDPSKGIIGFKKPQQKNKCPKI